MRKLLQANAQTDMQDNTGLTALMMAERKGHAECVRALREEAEVAEAIVPEAPIAEVPEALAAVEHEMPRAVSKVGEIEF